MEVIVLTILLGISIIVIGAICVVQIVFFSKDRRELQKLVKARDLGEFVMYNEPEEEEEPKEDHLIDIENIAEVFRDKK